MKKGLYNVVFGFLGQLVTILLGIIIPRLFISTLGSAANGLLSSAGQAIAYLNLLEAGIGAASIQALYKPISEKDEYRIGSILSATNQYYKKTGIVYFILVVIVSIVYPIFIKEFSYLTTAIVIFLSGVPGAIGYYFLGKYKVLLQAEGKSYIITNIITISSDYHLLHLFQEEL